jgi:hypothetical protein
MVANKVAPVIINEASRHKEGDFVTNALYQEQTKDLVAVRQKAMQYHVSLFMTVVLCSLFY